MGDEYGHSRQGNNNAYCQDNELNYFDWSKLNPKNIEFIHRLIKLRKHISRLHSNKFYNNHEISWHGLKYNDPAWNKDDGFLALHFHEGFFILYNFSKEKKTLMLPEGSWHELLHSHKHESIIQFPIDTSHYLVDELSVVILSKKPFSL
jgi:pullulanase/glycogen debranching enzyme